MREFYLDILIILIKKVGFIALFLIVFHQSFTQEKTYSISVKGENVVPFLFDSEDNDRFFIIRKKNNFQYYRLTIGYEFLKDERLNYRFGIGFDKIFENNEKWIYRFGIDLLTIQRKNFRLNEKFQSYHLNPFLKIDFKLSDNFYLSFEPGLDIMFSKNIDNSKRLVKNNYQEFETNLNNMGQIMLTFNFL